MPLLYALDICIKLLWGHAYSYKSPCQTWKKLEVKAKPHIVSAHWLGEKAVDPVVAPLDHIVDVSCLISRRRKMNAKHFRGCSDFVCDDGKIWFFRLGNGNMGW